MSKIKEFFSDIRLFNKKYKCAPLIIFALIYVASPFDLLPELFYDFWAFYLDDMAVLILAFVTTYLEVFYNERNDDDNKNIEGVYSAVRRGGGKLGSRGHIGGNSGFDSDAVHSTLVNQFPATELPAANAAESGVIPYKLEPSTAEFEPEPESERATADNRDTGYYAQHFLDSASKSDDCVQQYAEQSRPESFIFQDENTIIW